MHKIDGPAYPSWTHPRKDPGSRLAHAAALFALALLGGVLAGWALCRLIP